MRLIDADAQFCEEASDGTGYVLAYAGGIYTVTDEFGHVVCEFMPEQPTVDAVPVVWCKDCRYWERFNNTSLGTCYHGIYAGSNLGTPENHFCASAARMDGSEGE